MLCLYHVPISNLHNNDLKTKTFVSVLLFVCFLPKRSCLVTCILLELPYTHVHSIITKFSFEGFKSFKNLTRRVQHCKALFCV